MPQTIATDRRANLLGALWMVAAMAGFAIEDALIKFAAAELPVGQVLMLFGLGGAVVFAAWGRARGLALSPPQMRSRVMAIRAGFEVTGRLFYTLAIALTPLSATTVILQATPLVVVAAAALIFGERVGWRRWGAILIGLAGVMVILRPGTSGFAPLSVLAVLGMLGFAGRDLASRAAPRGVNIAALGASGFLAVAAAGAICSLVIGGAWDMPGPAAGLAMAGTVLAGAAAYGCLMTAMRTGEVSAVTPFRYTRLIFGVGLGVLVFGEALSLPMLIGSGLIVASGVFILAGRRR